MKTLDEVIKDLEECMKDDAIESEGFYLASDSLFYLKEYRWIVENCADALAEKYPSENIPLTWDELREMIGKPVWIEMTRPGYLPWSGWEVIDHDGVSEKFMSTYRDDYAREQQGKTWQAYRKERNENAE